MISATCTCGQQYFFEEDQAGGNYSCGQCGQPFTVPARSGPHSPMPAGPIDPLGTPDPYALHPGSNLPPVAHPSNPLPQPQAVPPSPGPSLPPRRTVGKGGSRWLKPLLLSGGGLFAATILVLILLSIFGGGKNVNGINVEYLPENVVQVYHAKVAKIAGSPSGKELIDSYRSQAKIDAIKKATGLGLEDIESLTIAYGNPQIDEDDFFREDEKFDPGRVISAVSGVINFCGVIRLSKEHDQQKILDYVGVKKTKADNGKEYFLVTPLHPIMLRYEMALAFPDPKTIIYGTEQEVQNALNGSKARNTDFFDQVSGDDDLIWITNSNDTFQGESFQTGNALSFGEDVDLRIWRQFESAAVARELQNQTLEAKEMIGMLTTTHFGQGSRMASRLNNLNPIMGMDPEVIGRALVSRHRGSVNDNTIKAMIAQDLWFMIPKMGTLPAEVAKELNQLPRVGFNPLQQNRLRNPRRPQANVPVVQPAGKKTRKEILAELPNLVPGKGNTIQLLDIIDLKKDVVKGQWTFQQDKLLCHTDHLLPRVQIPYQPPVEYDFEVTFEQANPRAKVGLVMPVNPGSATWTLNSPFHKHEFITKGRLKNHQLVIEDLIQPGVQHRILVQVRRLSVKGCLDGKVIVDYAGPLHELAADPFSKLKDASLLGFFCDTSTTVHQIKVTEVSGPGKFSN